MMHRELLSLYLPVLIATALVGTGARASAQSPATAPDLAISPINPVVGQPVTLTMDGGAAFAGSRATLFYFPSPSSIKAVGFGRMDSSGRLSFRHRQIPAITEGMAFSFVAAGLHPTLGFWKTNVATILVGDARHYDGLLLASDWRISQLADSGPAWDNVFAAAQNDTSNPNISNQDDNVDVDTLAKALVYRRTGDQRYRQEVIDTCMAAMGTELGGRTLALGRNLLSYVLAADLVGLPSAEDQRFRTWLRSLLDLPLSGRTLRSTHEDRPNNWGTHAGASRIAVALYLGDQSELDAAALVLRGFLGDRDAYSDFKYGDLSWQADPRAPVGINPPESQLLGRDVDGVIPDDQRRGGSFDWKPPKENYVYECLQGAILQAHLLYRRGYDAWNWEDQALRRAYRWLHTPHFTSGGSYPAQGDDQWQPWLVNFFYGAQLPAQTPARHGKNVGWTDWLFPSGGPY
ncbi:MAG: alginate lyase family protein [Planctomycetota bacterium]